MRFIPTTAHGVLDYLMGLVLIAAPWLLGFYDSGAAAWVPIVLGASAILYSLLTKYELGVFPVIPMKGHLGLDFGSGLLLAASPWLFGFRNEVYLPHLILGVAEVGAALFTKTVPTSFGSRARRHAH